MKIGIDIDDTITDTRSCVFEYKKLAYPERNPREMLPSDLYTEFMAKYELEIHKNAKLKENVVENIHRLHKNNEIIIITSRDNKSENITKEYLKSNNIPYDQIYFNISEKGQLAKNLGINIFIDDHNFICQQMSGVGVTPIKMHREDENQEFIEFTNWDDITNYILNEEGGNNGKNNCK